MHWAESVVGAMRIVSDTPSIWVAEITLDVSAEDRLRGRMIWFAVKLMRGTWYVGTV